MATIFFDPATRKIGADLTPAELAVVSTVIDLPGAREDLQAAFESFVKQQVNALKQKKYERIKEYLTSAELPQLDALLTVVNQR